MANEKDWTVVYYTDENGRCPVEEFLESLDDKTQVQLEWSIKQLRIRNIYAHEPLVRHLGGKLWELREESNTNIYRILYFFFTGRQIVFLHGFQKKSQKTPRKEIEVALQRLDRFVMKWKGEK
jgi:phage-related protein